VNGHESYDYKSALEKAGLVLKKAAEGKAWIGNVRYTESGGLNINSNTTIGTPMYNAGLDIDDQLTLLDGKPVKKAADINDILKDHKPGETVSIEWLHHNMPKTAIITLAENPSLTVTTFEKEGQTPTDAMLVFRKAWLGSKVR
jgi:predicted metalloprotease with PDZ domain